MKNISLYLHIPFCERKCFYCSFVSFCASSDVIQSYCDALCEEIKFSLNKEHCLLSIYLGGGTPSVLNESQIEQIFEAIKSSASIAKNAEITIEMNPNSITREKLEMCQKVGVNRISVGVQSLKDKSLKAIGRLHTSKQAKGCFKLIREMGFKNVSADLILGIPFSSKFRLKKDLNFLTKYCTHISAYSLILEEKTPLFRLVQEKKLKLPSEEKVVLQYEIVSKKLKRQNFLKYEVSNFALKGCESSHNKAYWTFGEYLGLGVSAHSFIDGERFSNPITLKEYFDLVKNEARQGRKAEKLSKTQMQEEFVMLSLRTSEGIDLEKYFSLFGSNLLKEKSKEIEFLKSQKLITLNENNLIATEKGLNVLNQIILKLI